MATRLTQQPPPLPPPSAVLLKTEVEFNFNSNMLRDYLYRTTENIDEKLWRKIFKFKIDTTCLRGFDYELHTPLANLKNPRLVYSLMLHFLGRAIFCSNTIHEKFKLLLKKRLKDSCNELENTKYKQEIEELSAKSSHSIEEIIAPYNQLSNEFQKWSNENITWDQYVTELNVRETIMSKLREKCNKYDLADSKDFFVDLLANLHLDNYCFKSLKSAKGNKEFMFSSERSIYWMFPLNLEIKCDQKRNIQSYRTDSVMKKQKIKYVKMEYKDLDNELDPYMHGGHMRAILGNDNDELDFYLKKHPGRQIITELVFLMYGVEIQKNPAAIMYNMMALDLIDGDKASQRECFDSGDPEHSKEKGSGGTLPFTFEGNTTASRYLNLYYSYIFDHWYSYDITEENEEKMFENILNPKSEYNTKREYKIRFEEMMQREYDLINKWITFKKERDRKARNLKTVYELWNYILTRTQQWFEPLKVKLVDIGNKNK